MTLLVLFRTRLEWCNFTCGYCPWNANETRVESSAFREDEARLVRVVNRVGGLDREVEFFITPKAEYLVLPYWRREVGRLLAMPRVRRVTVQTNLSFDVGAWLDEITSLVEHASSVLPGSTPEACSTKSPGCKLALWTTYHPGETELEPLLAKWDLLRRRGVPFSVGVVGTRENIAEVERVRRLLPADVYLWVNAYKREADYYAAEELARILAVDPLFALNNQHYASLGRPCTAGQRAVYLDDEGDLRRCFFVGRVLGNLFRDGWVTLDAPDTCPVKTCHCYVGHMHVVELGLREVYGENLAARIPVGWPDIILGAGAK